MKEKLSLLPDSYKHLIKYGIVGISNVLIYLGVNYFLVNNFDYFNRHLITANIIASIISFSNGLYFNRKWTFKSETHWMRDTIYILIIFGICTLIQSGIIALLIQYFRENSILSQNQYLLISQLIGAVVFAIINFTLNKLITFRKKPQPSL